MSSPLQALLQNPAIWRGDEQARVRLPSIPTGFAELDRELPGGGWPRGVVSELLSERSGIGELSLLVPALANLSREDGWLMLGAGETVIGQTGKLGADINARGLYRLIGDGSSVEKRGGPDRRAAAGG